MRLTETDSLKCPEETHVARALIKTFSCHPGALKTVLCTDAPCTRMKLNCVITHHPQKMNICCLYILHIPGPRTSESIHRQLASSLHISRFQKHPANKIQWCRWRSYHCVEVPNLVLVKHTLWVAFWRSITDQGMTDRHPMIQNELKHADRQYTAT